MGADELEDYLELQEPDFQRAIAESKADIKAGRTFPAGDLLTESKQENPRKRTGCTPATFSVLGTPRFKRIT